jgi:hypothetical protein
MPVIPPDEDADRHAMRLVAQRCLYGVDRNPMAVDLAKLSLWLATMAKDHPFTFLDHSIKCGDSLVGLTNRQIAAFHWDPTQAKDRIFGQEKLEQQIAKVAEQRKRILDWTEDTESAVLKKRDFLAAADSAAASLKTTGDLVIAAYFAGENPKQRQQNRDEFLHRHLELQKGDAQQIPWEINTLKQLRGGDYPIRPFHWEIEFPEVFSQENPGFDAIVGNPPFLGCNLISELSGGPRYQQWLKEVIAPSKGSVDLSVFFFRRSFEILREAGTSGLLATSALSYGDNRAIGLGEILGMGGAIYSAVTRQEWPGEATVLVTIVHLIKCQKTPYCGTYQINQKPCRIVNSRLKPHEEIGEPHSIQANTGLAHIGTNVGAIGFILDNEETKELLSDPHNKEILLPLVGGEEVNAAEDSPNPRFVICFGKRTLKDAESWPVLLDIVRDRVLPHRMKGKNHGPGIHGKKYWWQHTLRSDPLYDAIRDLSRCLVTSQVSTYHAIRFEKTGKLFNHKVFVFAFESNAAFAVLQSTIHEMWSAEYSSRLGFAINYSVSKAFATFPFPPDWETNVALEEAGRSYYEYRAALMVRNDEGLTKTYNRFHDPEERSPEIQQLRALHAAMDRAVLAAYGWPDIPTACEFLLDYEEEEDEAETTGKKRKKKKPYRLRWPDEVRDEVLARLLALNAERAAQEKLSGISKATAKKASKNQPINRPKREDEMI